MTRNYYPLLLLLLSLSGIVAQLYGIDYGVDQNNCPSYDQLVADLNIMKTYTNRVRIYQCWYCNNICLNMVKATQSLGMQLFIGLQPLPLDIYAAEKDALRAVNAAYGFGNVIGVSIGSEGLYRKDYTTSAIAGQVTDIKNLLTNELKVTGVPVGTADVYYEFDDTIINACDIILINAFSYWEGVAIENAAQTVIDHYYAVKSKPSAANKLVMFGETGWPTAGPNQGAAVPSDANQQKYLNDLVCQANTLAIPIYWFSAFDATGQSTQVENHWGLYDASKQKKPGFVLSCGAQTSQASSQTSQATSQTSQATSTTGGVVTSTSQVTSQTSQTSQATTSSQPTTQSTTSTITSQNPTSQTTTQTSAQTSQTSQGTSQQTSQTTQASTQISQATSQATSTTSNPTQATSQTSQTENTQTRTVVDPRETDSNLGAHDSSAAMIGGSMLVAFAAYALL